jgi:hypothetical protein
MVSSAAVASFIRRDLTPLSASMPRAATQKTFQYAADLPIVNFIVPNAVGADGRFVVRVAHNWFWPAAVLDPRTGLRV